MPKRFLEYLPIWLVGVMIGFTMTSIWDQTGLLKELIVLAREQRRLLFAANQRQYTAAAAAQREARQEENPTDA